MSSPANLSSPVALTVAITAAVCCMLLVLPGATVSSMYLNDLLIFLDGGYRVVHGQVPNRDFHTALGPLTFYIPGLGYWLTGRLGMAMPVGMSAFILLVAPIVIHVLQTRLRPLLAVPLGVFLILLLATPMNTGEIVTKISFAMFYNRIGWAVLALLLVMHLQPESPGRWQGALDIFSATVLTLILLYTKMTYGVVAVGFLLVTVLQQSQRRWAVSAIALCVLAGLLVEAFWGGTRAHIGDLVAATNVSGVTEWQIYVRSFLKTSGEYAIFLFFVALSLWYRFRITDVLFYGLCACAGFALLNQNFQINGVVTLLVAVIVAAEILSRHLHPDRMIPLAQGASLAAIVLMLPIGLSSAMGIGVHAALAITKQGVPLGTPNGEGVRIVNMLNRDQFAFYRDYGKTLETGSRLLASLDVPPSRVLNMDFVSPFTSLAGLRPPQGGSAWMHDDRNFDTEHHLPADEMLGGVDVVMIPKKPASESTTEKMEKIYGSYLDQHFLLIRVTDHWRLYQRRSLLDLADHPRATPNS